MFKGHHIIPVLLAIPALAQDADVDQPNLAHNYTAEYNARFEGLPLEQRAWPIYAKIEALLAPHHDRITTLRDANPGDEDWPEALKLLDDLDDLWPLIDELADRPTLGWEWADTLPEVWARTVDGSDEPVYEPSDNAEVIGVLLPHLAPCRSAATLLRLRALAEAQEGDTESAIAALEAIAPIARHALEGDHPITVMVAVRIQVIALTRGIRQVLSLAGRDLTGDQLARLQALTDGVFYQKFSLEMLVADEISMLDILQRIYTDDGHGDGLITLAGARLITELGGREVPEYLREDGGSSPQILEAIVNRLRANMPSRLATERFIRETYEILQAEAEAPIWQWSAKPTYEWFDEVLRTRNRDARIAAILQPAYGLLAERPERLRVTTDAARIAIALERYRRAHNTWPAALDALVPDFIPTVPLDWIDGRPFRYKLDHDGNPVVYSLGPDADDDNAIPLPAGVGEKYIYPSERTENPDAIPNGDWILWP